MTGLAAEMGEIEFAAFGIDQCKPAKAKYRMKAFSISGILQRPDIFHKFFIKFRLREFDDPVDAEVRGFTLVDCRL